MIAALMKRFAAFAPEPAPELLCEPMPERSAASAIGERRQHTVKGGKRVTTFRLNPAHDAKAERFWKLYDDGKSD